MKRFIVCMVWNRAKGERAFVHGWSTLYLAGKHWQWKSNTTKGETVMFTSEQLWRAGKVNRCPEQRGTWSDFQHALVVCV